MLGVTVPDIHRSLDKAVQATMIPAARVRGIYIDAARLEQYEQALVTAAIGGDEKAIATAVRVQERKATLFFANAAQGRATGPTPRPYAEPRAVVARTVAEQPAQRHWFGW